MTEIVIRLRDDPFTGKVRCFTEPEHIGPQLFEKITKEGGAQTLTPCEQIAMSVFTHILNHVEEAGERAGPRIITQ